MNIDFSAHDPHHLLGDSATHPIEPHYGTLAALLLLVGMSPQRRRALPAHRIAAHSGAPNCGFQVQPTHVPVTDKARDQLRAENDLTVARLYGIIRAEQAHLLRSFKGLATKRPDYLMLLQL